MAVDAFLAGGLKWAEIAAVVESALDHHETTSGDITSADVIAADERGRGAARKVLESAA